jgi:hypothetical protein
MKAEEVTRLEATVRAANPYPSVEAVAASEELVRMDALVRMGTSSGSVPSVDGRDIMQTQQQPPRETSRRTRSGWVAAGFAFAVVLVIGAGLAILQAPLGGENATVADQPTATIQASSSTAPPTTVTTTSVPATPPAVTTWQQVGTEVTEPVVGLSDIAAIGSGFVAAGFNPGKDFRQDGVILMSEDGLSWVRVAESDPALTTGTVLIDAIIEGGPGLIAVGRSCEDNSFPCEAGPFPTAWTSVDGSSWTRSVVGVEIGDMIDVVVSDSGLVAAGSITEFDEEGVLWTRPTVWMSDDGVEWSRTWQGEASMNDEYPPSRGVIGGLAVGPDGLMIAFGKTDDGTGGAVVAVWSSIDGETWERIEADSVAFTTEIGVMPMDASWGPTGFVMVGTEVVGKNRFSGGPEVDVAVWHSPDGRGWTRIDTSDQDFGTTGSLSSIVGNESGFTAAGPYGFGLGFGPVSVWISTDGLTWTSAGTVDGEYAGAIIATDTGTLIAGQTLIGDDDVAANYVAAIWIGPTLDPRSP